MTKARTLLGILLVVLSIGGAVLWQSGIGGDIKVLLTAVDVLLWLGAAVTLAFNVFSLDSRGRIAYNSLAWKYLSFFYGSMLERIKICPMYWLIVMGIFLFFAALAVGSAAAVIIYSAVSGYLNGEISALNFLIPTAITVFMFVFFYSLYKSGDGKNKFWNAVSIFLFTAMVLTTGSLLIYAELLKGATVFEIILMTAIFAGVAILFILGVCLFIALCVALISIFSVAKNTFFGQLVGAAYGKLCPVIPVEQASEGQESDRQRWDYSA